MAELSKTNVYMFLWSHVIIIMLHVDIINIACRPGAEVICFYSIVRIKDVVFVSRQICLLEYTKRGYTGGIQLSSLCFQHCKISKLLDI